MDSKDWEQIKEVFSSTLDLAEGDRASFLAGLDPKLRVEVEKLLTNFESAESFIEEPAFVQLGLNETLAKDNFIGKTIDDYLILEEIGTGGMGAVYLAEQRTENLSHRVALKLIKRGMDTNSVLKRFVQERQILANLEHPHIARFLDGGSTDDGLPYFVMEYVDGLPINKYCEKNGLDLRQRLELFRKVAAAVSFAHQNLIVHRDLKPSNILVAEGGEVKLLDFGIARLLNPDWSVNTDEATATMFRVMTPEYASPEQLRGLPATTSGDVYSLGVVLFEILTGTRPYKIESRSPDEVAREVFTHEPVKPSSVVSDHLLVANNKTTNETSEQTNPKSKIQNPKLLKGDLDNIILKALQKEPERRYSSVEEFSEDIRRHIDGLPVRATADTSFYRLDKFVKRHRTGVVAGGLIVLTLFGATAVTSWQAVVARRERDKAEMHFNQVRKLANTVLFDYHERIKNLPGATEIRRKLVTDSLEYLDNLAQGSSNSIDLQRELALAYKKIGDIQAGSDDSSNTGESDAALANYRKALAIQENIVAQTSESDSDQATLAKLLIGVAEGLKSKGELETSEPLFRQAVKILSGLVAKDPTSTELRSALADGFFDLASAVRVKNSYDEAINYYNQAGGIYEKLAEEKTGDRGSYLRNAALVYKTLGAFFEYEDRSPEALELYRKAVSIDMENTAAEPNNAQYQMDLSFSYNSVASALANESGIKDPADALESCQKALAIQEKVVAADAKNMFAVNARARTYRRMGDLLRAVGKPDDAVSYYKKSIRIFEELSQADPNNDGKKLFVARIYTVYGEFLLSSKETDGRIANLRESQKYLKLSLDIFLALKSKNPLEKPNEKIFNETQASLNQAESELARLQR